MTDIRTMPIPDFPEDNLPEPTKLTLVKKKATDAKGSPGTANDPVDFLGAFPVPELPVGILPASVEAFARTMAVQMGADAAGLAMSALLACAASIPDAVSLQVKEHDPHWRVSARLWVLLVGLPSTKKSPVIKTATQPLYAMDHILFEESQREIAVFNAQPKEARIGPPPQPQRLVIEDATMEATQQVLMGSKDGIVLINDEMSGFFGIIEKYSGKGAAADRAFWLKTFDGGQYLVNRVGRTGAIGAIIENNSISMLGGIQPEAIKAIGASATDDGLIQRFFPVLLKSAEVGQDQPVPDITEHYAQMLTALRQLTIEMPLKFDSEALRIRAQQEVKNHRLQVFEEIDTKLASHIGKYDGLFARLCLIWHCIEHAETGNLPPRISAQTARNVATFLEEFLLPHALSFYADLLGGSREQHQLKEVSKHILAHRLKLVGNTELQSNIHVTRKLTKQGRIALLETLEGFGWITELPSSTHKRSERWSVNPKVHELFRTRAIEIRQKKEVLKEVMAESFAQRRTQKND